jgi:diguanylate cyclase (GGDEF)-like protein
VWALRAKSRLSQSTIATVGLVTCSAVLVHLSGGLIEMHFHYFVVIGVITLYQSWAPFITAIAFVALQHGVLGVLFPNVVYDHAAAQRSPWAWAGIHAGFVLAASVAHVLAWRLNEDQMLRDPLTRLANRTLFGERLSRELQTSSAFGAPTTVMFLDLDRFKQVNDTMGHAAGDEMLVEVAQRLASAVGTQGLAARLGGDEFAVLLPRTDSDLAARIADRILDAVRRPLEVNGSDVVPATSIGITVVDSDATVEGVLRHADLALYLAKASGRDRYEFFHDALHASAMERAGLESDLRQAVLGHAIEVHYQPTVDLARGRVAGVEALARWDHPVRGPISPGVFIPIAESTGLIVELGRQVLREACDTGRRLRAIEPDLTINVNVSARQLSEPGFVEEVRSILAATELPGFALTLEITESVLMHDIEVAVPCLVQLRELGIRIAIDDFGTGYSSLSYLRHLPLDVLKIDKSFIDTLAVGDTEFTQVILRLAETLGLGVVAEGIESTPQLEMLHQLGCTTGQGFLFAPPVGRDEIERLLERGVTHRSWPRQPSEA